MNYKQVIVMRKDLGMRKGKIAAQAAHACLKVFFDQHSVDDVILPNYKKVSFNIRNDIYNEWISKIFTKVCVSVKSEEELLDIYNKAHKSNLLCSLIKDSGLTEFKATLCSECDGAIFKLGHTNNCGYPLCECGDKAVPGIKISVPTYTCCAIGPDLEDRINSITAHLPLL